MYVDTFSVCTQYNLFVYVSIASIFIDNGDCFVILSEPPVPPTSDGEPVQLVAKYNYQSNPNRPGGFDEMSLTAGEKLTFVSPHDVNPYWWMATRENGETAYVPASYVMVKIHVMCQTDFLVNSDTCSGGARPKRLLRKTSLFFY